MLTTWDIRVCRALYRRNRLGKRRRLGRPRARRDTARPLLRLRVGPPLHVARPQCRNRRKTPRCFRACWLWRDVASRRCSAPACAPTPFLSPSNSPNLIPPRAWPRARSTPRLCRFTCGRATRAANWRRRLRRPADRQRHGGLERRGRCLLFIMPAMRARAGAGLFGAARA